MEIINQFNSKIVGSTFTENGQDAIRLLSPNDKLRYVQEKDNKFDANAIAIYNEAGQRLGYVPLATAKGLRENLDRGDTLEIAVSAITGAGKESVGCNILITIWGERETSEKKEEDDTPYGMIFGQEI